MYTYVYAYEKAEWGLEEAIDAYPYWSIIVIVEHCSINFIGLSWELSSPEKEYWFLSFREIIF